MRVKICGITRLEDAELAARLGAWAIGFIFFKGSPRYLSPAAAGQIAAGLPSGLEKVGVFVNPTLEEVTETVQAAGLTLVQLHGEESPAEVRALGRNVRIIKAIRHESEVQSLSQFEAEAFLVDAASETARGGTGRPASRELARAVKAHGRLILAGGLSAANLSDAIHEVQPFALDVSSGVESSPGIKDAEKLQGLFAAVERVKR